MVSNDAIKYTATPQLVHYNIWYNAMLITKLNDKHSETLLKAKFYAKACNVTNGDKTSNTGAKLTAYK